MQQNSLMTLKQKLCVNPGCWSEGDAERIDTVDYVGQ